MSLKATWYQDKLKKKAKRGFNGYPIATVTYYGPNDQLANKVAVGIILEEEGEVTALQKWFADEGDIRKNAKAMAEVIAFIAHHSAMSVISRACKSFCVNACGINGGRLGGHQIL